MAEPASERASDAWLAQRSALGERMGARFENRSVMQLQSASDALMHHREAIERHLQRHAVNLFSIEYAVTLYDLTNTYFEGVADIQEKAQRGHSKEKRSDRPLLTLSAAQGGSGFVRRSAVFAGNVHQDRTLQTMMKRLRAPGGARVVMDRGRYRRITDRVATQHRLSVPGREPRRQARLRLRRLDNDQDGARTQAAALQGAAGRREGLYGWSEDREKKEQAIIDRFETALTQLSEGLSRPRTHKRLARIHERIGRLKAHCRGIAKYYKIKMIADAKKEKAVDVRWKRKQKEGSIVALPGCAATKWAPTWKPSGGRTPASRSWNRCFVRSSPSTVCVRST